MKKILCDKDGEFLFVYDENSTLIELNDGDYLTHEDGCIVIYKEPKSADSKVYYHAYLRNGTVHLSANEQTHYDFISSFRFSTEEEKEAMNNALIEKGLFYNAKSNCIEKIRWRAKKGYMYYYIDFNDPNSFCVASRTETFDYIDECKFNTHNYFQTEEEAEKKLVSIKSVLND